MPLTLRIVAIVASLGFLALVVRWVVRGRLQLKYSLMWLFAALLIFIFALFPQLVYECANLLGFQTASNFVFAVGLLVLLVIALGLSMVASWQARYIRHLIQEIALIKNELQRIDTDKRNDV